jgi:sugar phosphate isomerase/epimerase
MPKPKIGLSMLFCLGAPFSSLVKNLHNVNVSCVEILDEGLYRLNAKRLETIGRIVQSKGLELTLHAPFVDMNIASPNPILRRTILRQLEKSIQYASRLDCRLLVFHPGKRTGISEFYPGLDWRLNIEAMRHLLEVGKKHGVGLAVENLPEPFPFLMKSVDDFKRFFNDFDGDIGLALDVGHANIRGQALEFVRQFPEKIVHIHVSDNDGRFDFHRGIGYGNVDWAGVASAVKKSKYDGIIMLESIDHVEESIQKLKQHFT